MPEVLLLGGPDEGRRVRVAGEDPGRYNSPSDKGVTYVLDEVMPGGQRIAFPEGFDSARKSKALRDWYGAGN